MRILNLFPQKNHVNLKESVSFDAMDQRRLITPFCMQWPEVIEDRV